MNLPGSYTTGLPMVWGKCDSPVPKLEGPNRSDCQLISQAMQTEFRWLEQMEKRVTSDVPYQGDQAVSWGVYHASKQTILDEPMSSEALTSLLPLCYDQAKSVAMIRHSMNVIRSFHAFQIREGNLDGLSSHTKTRLFTLHCPIWARSDSGQSLILLHAWKILSPTRECCYYSPCWSYCFWWSSYRQHAGTWKSKIFSEYASQVFMSYITSQMQHAENGRPLLRWEQKKVCTMDTDVVILAVTAAGPLGIDELWIAFAFELQVLASRRGGCSTGTKQVSRVAILPCLYWVWYCIMLP